MTVMHSAASESRGDESMNDFKVIREPWTITETTRLRGLTIRPGAKIQAPEGKLVTMTLGGEGQEMVPGFYQGDIVLTVTDRIPLGTYPFRAGICVMDGAYIPEMSVPAIVKGGTCDDHSAENVSIVSHEENFNGFYLAGNSSYTINDVKVQLEGNGGNDFVGFGAGIFVGNDAKVTINRADIRTRGAARGTMFLAGSCDVTVNDSVIEGRNGVLPYDYIDTVTPGVMRAVPWMLGLRGNCRAFNLAESATAHFNRCTMKSEGWGVMSTDGVRVGRLYMKDSDIEITGSSGYGAFSINDCLVSFDSCTVKVPDIGLIVANGKASGHFTGNTTVHSDRFGVMVFRNTMGRVDVDPGVKFHTGETVFLVKGCTPEIHVKGAELKSDTGSILTLMDLDDPNDTGAYYRDPVGPDTYIEGRDLTTGIPGTDVVATFADMELAGNFYNSTTNLKAITGILDPDAPKAPKEPPYSGGPGTHNGPKPGPGGPAGAPNGAPGGAPNGAPAGAPPQPDGEMPEFFKKLLGMDKPPVKNLALTFTNTRISGVISSATAKHRVPQITKYNCEEIGEVIMTPAPAVNNGVVVTLEEGAVWTVTGTSYLTKLTIGADAAVQAQAGSRLTALVNGEEVALTPGQYTGQIVLSLTAE